MVYRIKPLEWEEMPIKGHWRALAFSCILYVHSRDDGRFQAICFPIELAPMVVTNRDTFEEAKAAAEKMYRERLAFALAEATFDDLSQELDKHQNGGF